MYRSRFNSRPSSGRRFSGGYGNRGSRGAAKLDYRKFINKAAPVEETEAFVPENSFTDFAIKAELKENIIARKYTSPTPIQDKSIPIILEGRDIVGIANTGTGKTAAFLIPLIDKILKDRKEKVLIMVPTRELAIQINEELREFVPGLGIYSACCVGGAPIGRQIADLRRRHNFVIGTPGRLKDLMERKFLDLGNTKTVVLDEADRMLDMGFIDDMRFMLAKMSDKKHTLFFSATLSREIENLISTFLKDPVRITVKTRDTAACVDQDVVRVGREDSKIEVLHNLLISTELSKVLIFGKTKHGVENLSVSLSQRGFKVESIHGDKPHSRRQKALSLFKENRIQALIATDVAARGLDIPGVTHVINYDLPATYEDYVHRIGRTGRAGHAGKALTFIEAY